MAKYQQPPVSGPEAAAVGAAGAADCLLGLLPCEQDKSKDGLDERDLLMSTVRDQGIALARAKEQLEGYRQASGGF